MKAPLPFTPHAYQEAAIRWIEEHPRCALFLDMGLGKTVSTLTALLRLKEAGELRRALIVAPKKVAEATWQAEAAKWAHLAPLRLSTVIGTPAKRHAALAAPADIYIIGRDNVLWLAHALSGKPWPFDCIVLDELTSFKSPSAKRSKVMRLCCSIARRVIGLTGTPAPNGLIDLWGQMACVDGGERLGKYITHYRERYFTPVIWNNIVIKCPPKPGAEREIRERLSDICLSMPASALKGVPPMRVVDFPVRLPDDLMKLYRSFERERVMDFRAGVAYGGKSLPVGRQVTATPVVTAGSAGALLSKLAQFAGGALYLDGLGKDTDGERPFKELHREKLSALREIVEGVRGQAGGGGVLVFYQFRADIRRCRAALRDYKVGEYRTARDLEAWNAGRYDVMLCHPASAAYGLNLQAGGHYAVWLTPGYDCELWEQANARLHRQGQEHPVTVYRLVCPGTADERACRALDAKQGGQRALMEAMNALLREYSAGKELRS